MNLKSLHHSPADYYRTASLFLIIFLEGYVVLSAELLAIRQTLPFVGSGTDTVAIIIAAVLLPLAFGYYRGGQMRGKIREKLTSNILKAALILTLGLSYAVVSGFFSLLHDLGLRDRLIMTSLYALFFIAGPVYLLGQTVPLTSNYIRLARLSETAGKILFFSTLGSFLGAVFTTLFLMNTIGVNHTVTAMVACLTLLVFLITHKRKHDGRLKAVAITLLCLALNSPPVMGKYNIVSDNAYNTIQIESSFGSKTMRVNRQYASGYYPKEPERYWAELYERVQEDYIKTFDNGAGPAEILVIGAAGFTVGMNDRQNRYTYVDIDPAIKDVAETHFLPRPLQNNQHFEPTPIRAWLNRNDKKFDLIFLDAHSDIIGAPEHLLTAGFFMQLKNHLKDNGILYMNIITGAYFENEFSRTLDNTIRYVFPYINRELTNTAPPPWQVEKAPSYTNVIYVYRHDSETAPLTGKDEKKIYTDNLNRSMLDRRDFTTY